MKKSVEKKHKFRIFKVSNIVALVVCIYATYTFTQQQIQLNKYNSQIETYEMQISAKQESLEFYTVDKENESTDEYIEKVARESLGLVKPYEKVYIDVSK